MKNTFKSLVVASSIVLASGATFAESAQSNINLFSDCGIGAALFPDAPVGAVSSNIIWDLGTTATSTFLSTPESCVNRAAQVAVLINDTYKNIAEETAAGEGRHLVAMMDIMECDQAVRSDLIKSIRADFKSLVSADDYSTKAHADKANDFYKAVITNVEGSYSAQCNLS